MLMDVSVGCVPVVHVCEGLESLSCIAGQQQAGQPHQLLWALQRLAIS